MAIRSSKLDTEFLAKTLQGASKYLRIAGYFRSSIFELVGEEIARILEVKIVFNSELDVKDFQVAAGRESALKERWNQADVGAEAVLYQDRYARLDALLKAGNVEIRVVPRERLFLHGKAGSVHYPDGRKTAFMGSVNETRRAFAHNYELIWEDDEENAATWVEDEFWALWKDGIPLPDAILKEIVRGGVLACCICAICKNLRLGLTRQRDNQRVFDRISGFAGNKQGGIFQEADWRGAY